MNRGVRILIYPVRDVAHAKALFRELLGVDPYVDQPYYVGYKIADQEIGLDPYGHRAGMTAYHHVDDIRERLDALVRAGAEVREGIRDVGGGRLIATLEDPDGNIIGLLQDS